MLTTLSKANDEIVTLAALKDHCRVDIEDDDSYLEGLRESAIQLIESETSQCFREYAFSYVIGCFPHSRLYLPKAPLATVEEVTYYDTSNVQITMVEETDYRVVTSSNLPGFIYPVSYWPSVYIRPDAVSVTFTCGYTIPPATLTHAVKLLVGEWYTNREATINTTINELPFGVQRLIDQLCVVECL
jgi:uncharacterized phiE125 gp8 family phage protein